MIRDLNQLLGIQSSLEKIKSGADRALDGVAEITTILDAAKSSLQRTKSLLDKVLSGAVPSAEEWKVFHAEPSLR